MPGLLQCADQRQRQAQKGLLNMVELVFRLNPVTFLGESGRERR